MFYINNDGWDVLNWCAGNMSIIFFFCHPTMCSMGSGAMGRGREVYRDCSREARKNIKAFFSGEQKNETLNNSDKNKKQEGWSSLNFLFGKGTFYTDFSTTAVKFLIVVSFTLITVGSFTCVLVLLLRARFFCLKC